MYSVWFGRNPYLGKNEILTWQIQKPNHYKRETNRQVYAQDSKREHPVNQCLRKCFHDSLNDRAKVQRIQPRLTEGMQNTDNSELP